MTDPNLPRLGDPAAADPADSIVVRHRTYEMPGRRHRLYVRLSDSERQQVADAALAARLTPAGFAAKAALAAASAQIAPTVGLADTLRQLQRELFAARRAVNMFASNVNQAAAAYNSTSELPDWVAEAVTVSRAAVQRLDEVSSRIDRRLR